MRHVFDALCDLADLALGCKSCRLRREHESLERLTQMGGMVYLWNESVAVHVGVVAEAKHCSDLARRLLGKPQAAALPEGIVRGAMCELAYLLGGGVRRRLRAGVVSVGQPSFIEGVVEARGGWRVESTSVVLDDIPATLLAMTRA